MIQSSFDGEVSVQSNQTVGKTSFGKNLRERIYYYLVSYNFDIINNDWKLEPIIFSRTFNNQNIVTDFITRIKYLDNNWLYLRIQIQTDNIIWVWFYFFKNAYRYSYDCSDYYHHL